MYCRLAKSLSIRSNLKVIAFQESYSAEDGLNLSAQSIDPEDSEFLRQNASVKNRGGAMRYKTTAAEKTVKET